MKTAIEETQLYELIKRAVREVIREEEFALFLSRIPEMSDEEMEEINAQGDIPGPEDFIHEETVEV